MEIYNKIKKDELNLQILYQLLEVLKQIEEITIRSTAEQQMRKLYEPRLQELLKENAELKTKNAYLENKIKEVISNAIIQRKDNTRII